MEDMYFYNMFSHPYLYSIPQNNAQYSNNNGGILCLLIILIIIIICVLCYMQFKQGTNSFNKNTFASNQAIADFNKTKDIYSKNPNSPFSEYKNAISNMDAPKFSFISNNLKNGTLTPDHFDNS